MGGNFSGNNGQGKRLQSRGMQGERKMGEQNEGGFMEGEILSKDDKSIIAKDRNGNSKIIFLSDATLIGKSSRGSIADLNIGENIIVNGQTNADGSMTAQNIQIHPAELK